MKQILGRDIYHAMDVMLPMQFAREDAEENQTEGRRLQSCLPFLLSWVEGSLLLPLLVYSATHLYL